MIGSEFVMPDPDREKDPLEKLEREEQLQDAVDVFSWQDKVGWWMPVIASVAVILAFALYGIIYP